MQPVYVMNEKDKAVAGFVTVVLLLVVGLWWGYNQVFPSDDDRVSSIREAQYQLDDNLPNLDKAVEALEKAAENPAGQEIGSLGEWFGRTKDRLQKCQEAAETIAKNAKKLKRSSDVEMQLRAAGFAEKNEKVLTSLPPLAKRLAEVETKLKSLVR